MKNATTSKATEANTITVGTGATIYGYSDIHAATVIAVSASGKRITLRRDKATLINGFDSGEKDALKIAPGGFAGHVSGQQRYVFEEDLDGTVEEFSLRTYRGEDRWVRVGETAKGGMQARLGKRSHHYDYNF